MKHAAFRVRTAVTDLIDTQIIAHLPKHRQNVSDSVKNHLDSVNNGDRGKRIMLAQRSNLKMYYGDYSEFVKRSVRMAIDYSGIVSNENKFMHRKILNGIDAMHNLKFMKASPKNQKQMKLHVMSGFIRIFGNIKTQKLITSFNSFFDLHLNEYAIIEGNN